MLLLINGQDPKETFRDFPHDNMSETDQLYFELTGQLPPQAVPCKKSRLERFLDFLVTAFAPFEHEGYFYDPF